MSKRFLISLIILCVLVVGGWYGYQKFFVKKHMSDKIPATLVEAFQIVSGKIS